MEEREIIVTIAVYTIQFNKYVDWFDIIPEVMKTTRIYSPDHLYTDKFNLDSEDVYYEFNKPPNDNNLMIYKKFNVKG